MTQPTTGVLLFATSSVHADKIGLQFRQREIDKTYLAVVRGGADRFPAKSGAVEPAWDVLNAWPWGTWDLALHDRRAPGMGTRMLVRKGDKRAYA